MKTNIFRLTATVILTATVLLTITGCSKDDDSSTILSSIAGKTFTNDTSTSNGIQHTSFSFGDNGIGSGTRFTGSSSSSVSITTDYTFTYSIKNGKIECSGGYVKIWDDGSVADSSTSWTREFTYKDGKLYDGDVAYIEQ